VYYYYCVNEPDQAGPIVLVINVLLVILMKTNSNININDYYYYCGNVKWLKTESDIIIGQLLLLLMKSIIIEEKLTVLIIDIIVWSQWPDYYWMWREIIIIDYYSINSNESYYYD